MKKERDRKQAAFYTILRRVKKKHPDLTKYEARACTIVILKKAKAK